MACFTQLFWRRRVREGGAEKDQTATDSSHGTNSTSATAQSTPRTFPRFTVSLPDFNLFLFTRNFANKTFFASQQHFPIADLRSAGLTFDNMSLSDQSINMAATSDEQEPPKKKQKYEVILCDVCTNTIDGDEYLCPCRDCRKVWCYNCVGKHFENAMHDHGLFPARCCGKVYYHGLAEGSLEPAELTRYKARFVENNTPNPTYCPNPTCSTFIPPHGQEVVNDKITCPACGGEACIKCKNVATDGHDCSRDDIKAIAEKFGYKMCPRCGTGIMRMYGCAHMQCRCGAHWCWHCQRPIEDCESDGCDQRYDEEEEGDNPPNDDDVPAPVVQPAAQPAVAVNPTVESIPTESTTADNTTNGAAATEPTVVIAATTPTDTASPAGHSSTEAEPFVNLDDPDAKDWEAILELNDEPEYEDRSMFGCQHYFREFGVDAMPDKWLRGLNKLKGVKIECMSCFKPIKVNGTVANEKESKKKNKANRKAFLAYDCELCALIVCWGCKERAMEREKTN